MVLILAIVALLTAFLLWMLLTPVILTIDTDRGRYELAQKGIFRATFHPLEVPWFRIRVMGFRIETYRQQNGSDKDKEKKSLVVKSKRSRRSWMILLKGVYRSITVRNLIASVDIDDVVLNAQLVPIMLLVSHGPIRLSTNFEKRNFIYVVVQLRLNRLIWPVVRFFTKKQTLWK